MMLNILNLIDDGKCFETVRSLRWPDGVSCPHCASSQVIHKGCDDSQPARQRYACSACQRRFDDLTGTIDYYQVTRRLLAFGENRPWKLIETLAVDIAGMILQEFGPQAVTVRVKKFILPETRYVAVEATRTKAR